MRVFRAVCRSETAWRLLALLYLPAAAPCVATAGPLAEASPAMEAELIFPPEPRHNHAPGIVATRAGDLLVSWYRGSGERTADDVVVYAAWRKQGDIGWGEPFVLADTPGFPDCNTALFIDDRQRLWLFYPTVLANSWESCLTNVKVASRYAPPGPPAWDREGLILLKPEGLGEVAQRKLDADVSLLRLALTEEQRRELDEMRDRLADKLHQRLGWQPRCKPTQLPGGRLVLPLYSDTFSASVMAISDDGGQTWRASSPLLGWGNIQPTVLRRADGTLVAYMRENGVTGRVRVAESSDAGESWGDVGVTGLPNPGSGLDGLRLSDGTWLLVYNDTTQGRRRLAVSISRDEGRTWAATRHLEGESDGQFHYPAVTQASDGRVHVAYSHFTAQGKSIKHAAFDPTWVEAGDR